MRALLLKELSKGNFTYNAPDLFNFFERTAWQRIKTCVFWKGSLVKGGYPFLYLNSPLAKAASDDGKNHWVLVLALLLMILDLPLPDFYGGPNSEELSHDCEAFLKVFFHNLITHTRYFNFTLFFFEFKRNNYNSNNNN